MDQDEYRPQPEPHGSLVPPTRHPPTAVGVATPPPPRPSAVPRRRRRSGLLGLLSLAVNTTLDAADAVGDAVAGALGLRSHGREVKGPPPPPV